MKSGEWKKAVRAALRDEDGADRWDFSRSLAYRTDSTWMVRGVLAESSGVGLGEYLWVVRAPLFVPADVLDLTFSTRLPDRTDEEITAGPSAEAIRAALRSVPNERTALAHIADSADPRNLLSLEAAAYASVILGRDDSAAVAMLDQACAVPPEYPWMKDAVDRADGIRSLLATGAGTAALERLLGWARETAARLKLRLHRDG